MSRLHNEDIGTRHQPAFDMRWRRLTEHANRCLDQGDLRDAGIAYDQAYHEARMIFAEAWNGYALVQPHAAPMMVVSATNAAGHRRAIGQPMAAHDQLASGVRIFVEALNSHRAADGLKRACAEHLPRLLNALGDDTVEAREIALSAKEAALAYWKKNAH